MWVLRIIYYYIGTYKKIIKKNLKTVINVKCTLLKKKYIALNFPKLSCQFLYCIKYVKFVIWIK